MLKLISHTDYKWINNIAKTVSNLIPHLHHKDALPKLDINLPVDDQVDSLRKYCIHALEKGLIRKTTANRGGTPALFTKLQPGINENSFPNGVHVKTGNKFLKEKKVSRETIYKIFRRFNKICPEYFIK